MTKAFPDCLAMLDQRRQEADGDLDGGVGGKDGDTRRRVRSRVPVLLGLKNPASHWIADLVCFLHIEFQLFATQQTKRTDDSVEII